MSSHYSTTKFPALLILLNGRVVEFLEIGPGRLQLKGSLLGCLTNIDASLSRPILAQLDSDMRDLGQSYDHTIHPAEVGRLEKLGFLRKANNGMREISSSTIFSESSDSTGPSESGPPYAIEIPEMITSQAALRYVGFSDEAAATVWNIWETRPADFPFTLEQTAVRSIKSSTIDAEGLEDDWRGLMETWGIKESLIDRILAPEFSDIRTSRSAKFWITQCMTRLWRSLERIQRASRQRLLKHKHGVNSMRRVGAEWPVHLAPSVLSPALRLRGGAIPEASEASENTPGSLILYRGMDYAPTKGLVDEDTGEYNLQRIYDDPPTDFRGGAGYIVYFALEKAMAERYAKYIKHMVGVERTCILEMEIPNSLITQMEPVVLRYGDAWKKILWASRRSEKYPKPLSHFQGKPLYIGDTCHSHTKTIANMSSWQNMTRDNLLTIDEQVKGADGKWTTIRKAGTQFAFFGDDMQETLEKKCSFRVLKSIAG